jgi:hypothetical protein
MNGTRLALNVQRFLRTPKGTLAPVFFDPSSARRPRLGYHRPCPQRGRFVFRMRNGGSPRHARRLRRIHIQFVRVYDFDSVFASSTDCATRSCHLGAAERLIASQH